MAFKVERVREGRRLVASESQFPLRINLRVTADQKAHLERRGQELGLKGTEYLRMIIDLDMEKTQVEPQ